MYKKDLELIAPRWSDPIIRHMLPCKNPFTAGNIQKHVIFIHIPKNAGRSINSSVFNEASHHVPLRRYYTFDKQLARSYFKFAIVRHPVDRFISAFYGLKGSATGHGNYSRFVRKYIDPFETLDDFVYWMAGTHATTCMVLNWLHFWPQYKWITLDNKNLHIDNILYFESLDKDWPMFAHHHSFSESLPLIGKGKKLRGDLESQAYAFLRDTYRDDFNLFGYS